MLQKAPYEPPLSDDDLIAVLLPTMLKDNRLMDRSVEPILIAREELYRRLWETPATKLAKEFGISDVAMIYLCRRFEIPKPPKGYWMLVARGTAPDRPPLPPLDDLTKSVVEITPQTINQLIKEAPLERQGTTSLAAPEVPQIQVADILRSPHPLVERTNQALRESTPDNEGIVRPKWTKCLNVNVGKAEIGRAMRLLDALFKAAIARGMEVRVDFKDGQAVTYLSEGGVDMKLRLSEMLGDRPKKLSAEEKKRYEGWGRHYLYEKHPRGEFSFALEGKFGNAKTWYEKDGKSLEGMLDGILATAVRIAKQVRQDQQRSDEFDRQYKIEQEKRRVLELHRQQQKLLRAQLREQMERWERAEAIRTFVAAARDKAGPLDVGSDFSTWLQWALGFADEIDPLRDAIHELPKRHKKDYLPHDYPKDIE